MIKSRRHVLFFALLLPTFSEASFFHNKNGACTLECRNGGVCKETVTEIHTGGDVHNARDYAPARKYYCECPKYFAGPECEVEYSICTHEVTDDDENDGHSKSNVSETTSSKERLSKNTCDNGSPCTQGTDAEGHAYLHCGCRPDTTDYASAFARRNCLRMGTVFCLPDNKKAEEIHQSLGNAGGAFCRNGGTCKEFDTSKPLHSQHHPGCNCPLNWTGDHCEIPGDEAQKAKYHVGEPNSLRMENEQTRQDEQDRKANVRLTIAWICLVVVLTMLGGIGFAVFDGMRESQRQRQRRLQRATQIPRTISAKIKRRMEPLEVESF